MEFLKFLKSKAFFIQAAIAIGGFLLFIFALQWWLGFTTNHDQRIQVPDLNRMSFTKAVDTLQSMNLDYIVQDSTRYNPSYPNKSVMEQTPEAGDFVKAKRKIYLTLNPSKYRDIAIPDLNGRTKRQAMTQLQSIGFQIGEFSYVRDIGKDVVRGLTYQGKKLKPGTKLPKNSTIDLILGDGKR